jgi:hypothetical protein
MACSVNLPPVKADLCDAGTNFGEIAMIMFTRVGDGLTSVTSASEWEGRIDNDTTTIPASPSLAPIRQLFGIGSVGKPERNSIRISRRRKQPTTPKYTLTFKVEDTGDENMDFATAIVNGEQYQFWFGTEDRIFGGNAGILATVYADPIIPESSDELQVIEVTVEFEGAFPEVANNPL